MSVIIQASLIINPVTVNVLRGYPSALMTHFVTHAHSTTVTSGLRDLFSLEFLFFCFQI